MTKKISIKIYIIAGFFLLFLTLVFLYNYAKMETKEITLENKELSNNLTNSKRDEESKLVNKSNLIAFGKWMASPEADENFDYFTYQVVEEDPDDGERKMILTIFDSNEKEIYKENFNTIYKIYPIFLLHTETEQYQLAIFYNLGGSGEDLKILSLRNGKISSIFENDSIHLNGDIAFIPTSTEKGETELPLQIVDIGTVKISKNNNKVVKIFRYKDNKYRYYGSGYYKDFINYLNQTITEDGPVTKKIN